MFLLEFIYMFGEAAIYAISTLPTTLYYIISNPTFWVTTLLTSLFLFFLNMGIATWELFSLAEKTDFILWKYSMIALWFQEVFINYYTGCVLLSIIVLSNFGKKNKF